MADYYNNWNNILVRSLRRLQDIIKLKFSKLNSGDKSFDLERDRFEAWNWLKQSRDS